jgi:hypothetical protein
MGSNKLIKNKFVITLYYEMVHVDGHWGSQTSTELDANWPIKKSYHRRLCETAMYGRR